MNPDQPWQSQPQPQQQPEPQQYFSPEQQQAQQAAQQPAPNAGQWSVQPGHSAPPPQHEHINYERPRDPDMHPMVVMQPGEQIVATLKRHPFGIVSLYVSALIGIVVASLLAFVFLPSLFNQYNVTGANSAIYAGLGILVVVLLLVLFVATSVYWQNQWVITTDSITQITQNGLFGRQVAQLSMDNLEDVTVTQDGIIPHMFGFGTLKVETAGERAKFQFPYCPDPTTYARKILEAHEQFLEERRNIQNHPSAPSNG